MKGILQIVAVIFGLLAQLVIFIGFCIWFVGGPGRSGCPDLGDHGAMVTELEIVQSAMNAMLTGKIFQPWPLTATQPTASV